MACLLEQAGKLAGAGGFEPPNAGTKNRCLTTWRRPTSAGAHSRAPGQGKGALAREMRRMAYFPTDPQTRPQLRSAALAKTLRTSCGNNWVRASRQAAALAP
jgi:hypothetical protein